MKSSNKISAVYVICSVLLLLALGFGGVYGIYVSVGLEFMRSTISNVSNGTGGASMVSYGGMASYESSMTGVIILSVALIVLAIFDLISLIKQISLFKQFKIARTLDEKFNKKNKMKRGAIIAFAIVVDLLSLALGSAGIFINMQSFASTNMTWVLYAVDGLVGLLGIVSLVLLFVKLSIKKKQEKNFKLEYVGQNENIEHGSLNKNEHLNNSDTKFHISNSSLRSNGSFCINDIDIDDIEYKLLKLKNLRTTKMITPSEYQKMRTMFLNLGEDEESNDDTKNVEEKDKI